MCHGEQPAFAGRFSQDTLARCDCNLWFNVDFNRDFRMRQLDGMEVHNVAPYVIEYQETPLGTTFRHAINRI